MNPNNLKENNVKDLNNWLENDPSAKKLIDNIVEKALDENYFIPVYGKKYSEITILTGDGLNPPRGEILIKK
jgi:hypothetical protein